MKTYEICYSNSITINKGNYENEKPFYSQKVVIQSEEDIDTTVEYEKLRAIIDPMALEHFNQTKIDQAGLRIRNKDGKKYPSVTSILGGGKPYTADPEYGIRGTEVHRLCNKFFFDGVWEEPKEALKNLKYSDIKYKEFFENYKDRISYNDLNVEIEIFNDEHLYSGEIDVVLKVDGVRTLADIKTGGWKLEQLVAYWKALQDKTIKQLAVFDLKKQKLEVFKVSDEKCRSAWENFLKLRGALNAKFDV